MTIRWIRTTATVAALATLAGCTGPADVGGQIDPTDDAHRVGVLLTLSGPDAVGYELGLEWAVESVNDAGGIDGVPLRLEYHDTAVVDVAETARALAADPGIVAVIGPGSSGDTLAVADILLQAGTPMVSPSATSGALTRAFGHDPLFWRTVESDVGQVQALLLAATVAGSDVFGDDLSVGLLAAEGPYGDTFFDLFAYTATRLDLPVAGVDRYRPGEAPCDTVIEVALESGADVLVVVPAGAEDGACMARRWAELDTDAELLFPDNVETLEFADLVGEASGRLMGTGLAPDPSNGFAEAFEARYGTATTPYAANAHDAVLLIAYGLARSDGLGGSDLATAMREVVEGDGPPLGWHAEGVQAALEAIGPGSDPLPDVTGATGPLRFAPDTNADLAGSTYRLWGLTDDGFTTITHLATIESIGSIDQRSMFDAVAGDRHTRLGDAAGYEPADRTGSWALLAATSTGWTNYRHHADVFAHYRALVDAGFDPDRIVVIADTDVVDHSDNPTPGRLRHRVDGPLIGGVPVDYHPGDLDSVDLTDVLAGAAGPRLDRLGSGRVIDSGPGDDVFVFLAGHGDRAGLHLGAGDALADGDDPVLSPEQLATTTTAMFVDRRFRRMLILVEACHGSVLGEELETPGVALVAGAAGWENSLSTNYDPELGVWLADQFALEVVSSVDAASEHDLARMVELWYLGVSGSHVTVHAPRFGPLGDVPFTDFVGP